MSDPRPLPTFRTDPVPYDLPADQAGDGVRLEREGNLAFVTAYSRHHGADGTTRAMTSQSTGLTARQLRTLATDAMAMAADMLVDGEEERRCFKCGALRGTPGDCPDEGIYSGHLHQW